MSLGDLVGEILNDFSAPADTGTQEPVANLIRGYLNAQKDRDSISIPISGVWKACARMEFLGLVFGMNVGFQPDLRLRLIMNIGAKIHELVQDTYLQKHLYGYWTLPCGHSTTVPGWYKDLPGVNDPNPDKLFVPCPECGNPQLASSWQYKEMALVTPLREIELEPNVEYPRKFTMKGRPDMVLATTEQEHVIGELKSINDSGFKWKRKMGPDPAHACQVNCYVCIWNSQDWRPFKIDYGSIVYVNKNGSKKGEPQFLEFRIEPNEEQFEAMIEKSRLILDVRDEPRLTDRICKSPKDERAKWCPMKDQCFNDHILATAIKDWEENGSANREE